MPAANQTPDPPPFRISSTGVSQEVGGTGDKTSSILKSPSESRATRFELVGRGRVSGAAEQCGENACSSVGPDTISGGKKKAASLDPDPPVGAHIRAEVRDSPRPGRIDTAYDVKGGNSIRGNTGNRNDPDAAPEFQVC